MSDPLPELFQRYPTNAARHALAKRFGLPIDPRMQDWEWEVADPSRLDEFLDAYSDQGLSDDERFSLMEIILEGIESSSDIEVEAHPAWEPAKVQMLANPRLHAKSIHYWACLEHESLEDSFRVAKPMRRVWEEIRPTLQAARLQQQTPPARSSEADR